MNNEINKAIIALTDGFSDAGCQHVSNYPGFHSQTIFSKLGGKRASINERVAYQVAYGVSLSGNRTVLTIKNVGLNVCSDEFLHSLLSGVCGGMVVVLTEDTDVVASQERQDSRHFFSFFGGLWFEPSTLAEAYTIAYNSFFWSEEFDVPVVIRLTNKYFKTKGTYKRLQKKKFLGKACKNYKKFIVYPHHWYEQYTNNKNKNKKISKFVEKYHPTGQFKRKNKGSKIGVIVVGSSSEELTTAECKKHDILRITTYPLPYKKIEKFSNGKSELFVYEDGENFVRDKISHFLSVNKKSGEGRTNVISKSKNVVDNCRSFKKWDHLEKLFLAIKKTKPSYVVGDVGSYTIESTNCINSCLCLGSSIGVCVGLVEGGIDYPVCIIGDAAFLHGGKNALSEAVMRKTAMGIIIIDNGGLWSTGGQKLASNIYDIDNNIRSYIVDYDKSTESEIENVLKKMKRKNKLSILYIKIKQKGMF